MAVTVADLVLYGYLFDTSESAECANCLHSYTEFCQAVLITDRPKDAACMGVAFEVKQRRGDG